MEWIVRWVPISHHTPLNHWGRVTHICASKLTIIDSNNCLSPDQRQAIIGIIAGILLTGPLGTNFSAVKFYSEFIHFHQKFIWDCRHEMAAILFRLQCVNEATLRLLDQKATSRISLNGGTHSIGYCSGGPYMYRWLIRTASVGAVAGSRELLSLTVSVIQYKHPLNPFIIVITARRKSLWAWHLWPISWRHPVLFIHTILPK